MHKMKYDSQAKSVSVAEISNYLFLANNKL